MLDGWGEIKLSQVLQLKNTKLGPHVDEPAIFAISKHEGVILASDFFGKRIASKNLDGYKILEPRDWVYSTIHIDEGSIATNHHPHSGVVSPMYTTMSWFSEDNSAGYFELLLRSSAAITIYGENAQGSINRRRSLPFARFSQLKFSVPPLAEQQRIVDLVSSVDSYIEALRQQLEKATNFKNAYVNSLVLQVLGRGNKTKIADVAEVKGGKRLPKGTPWSEHPTRHRYIRATDVKDGLILSENLVYVPDDVWPTISRYVVNEGDVVITIAGTIGQVGLVTESLDGVNLTENAAKIVVNRGLVDPNYLCMVLGSAPYQREIDSKTKKTTQPKLGLNTISRIEIPLPDLAEQVAIVSGVNQIELFAHKAQILVSKTIELRSGLLSNLLSGNHEIPASYDQLTGAA